MRSVVVVFPASMWAMMPMFLQRSNGTVLGTTFLLFLGLSKSAVSSQPLRLSAQGRLSALSLRTLVILSGVLCREGPMQLLTTGNARTPYWLPPCGVHLLFS